MCESSYKRSQSLTVSKKGLVFTLTVFGFSRRDPCQSAVNEELPAGRQMSWMKQNTQSTHLKDGAQCQITHRNACLSQ